jgi:type IV secretion system protein VirB9
MKRIHFHSALLLMALAICTVSAPAYATRESRPIQLDHRVRTIMYQPDQVFKFTGHYRYQSAIEFSEGESIQTISMGDSTAWMLNPSGNRLFLKPVEQDATTNMTVITNRRTYLFELHGRDTDDIADKDMVFVMRFIYPDSNDAQTVSHYLDTVPNLDIEENREKYNFNYTIAGTDDIAPLRVFDDGEFTFFQFKDKNADVPAFFMVNDHGEEAVINYRTRGDYIVVERVSKRMTLRHGTDIVCVFNEAMLARSGRP